MSAYVRNYPLFSTFLTSASIGGSVLRTTIAYPAAVKCHLRILHEGPLDQRWLLHPFQHVDFGALGAETLDDCAFVGGDDIGRNVIAQQIVTTDFQDDDVRPWRHGGI
jgi:hypothetical protein